MIKTEQQHQNYNSVRSFNFLNSLLNRCMFSAVKAGAPGSLKIDDVGPNAMSLSWNKPWNDGGSPIKGTKFSLEMLENVCLKYFSFLVILHNSFKLKHEADIKK